MPHIDIERLVLNYSYHFILCIIFSVSSALSVYISQNSLNNILKFKNNLVIAMRYKFRNKN